MSRHNKISKNHHYVPQYHLKGFLNDAGSFFIFDKKINELRETNTKDVLFEKERNTIINSKGEKDDLLEKLYYRLETVSLPIFKKIQDKKWEDVFSHYDKLFLAFYIALLYWRLPATEGLSDAIRITKGLNATPFRLSKKDGAKIEEKDLNSFLSQESVKKAYRLMLPFGILSNPDCLKGVFDWQLLFNDPGYFIIGDNPIIKRAEKDDINIFSEFVAPLSKECLLVNNSVIISENLPNDFYIQMALLTFDQAERYVCCHNKLFLEKIIGFYNNVYKKYNKIDIIKSELFGMLDKSHY